ncbi:MAG: master DNA invertase Mpi family serine-type recombinase [Alphaproteobacteria bacterium]|nr:master DNA invertase Mpi family serine-type recombinase [Alphaproteobacteria bacterium]
MIYGYIRVSTDKQNTKNQQFEIHKFCQQNKIKIDRWIKEIANGSIDYKKRRLGILLQNIQAGDMILASEISRFGRNLLQIMSILNICSSKGVRIWTIKDSYRLDDDIQSKVLAFAFALSAEIERKLISQRTKEALSRLQKEGHKLGRPLGHLNKTYKLDKQKQNISFMLLQNYSKREIAQIIGVSRTTLITYLQRHQELLSA